MINPLLKPQQVARLEELANQSGEQTYPRRARILLLYQAGKETGEIAEIVGISRRSARYWRSEFVKRGMEIFSPARRRSGQPRRPEKRIPTSAAKSPRQHVRPHYPRVRNKVGIKPDDAMAEAGRKVMQFHFAHMLSHERGTRLGEDIEELHDMRVATRRMRAAFEVFGPFFRPKVIKAHLKGLRVAGRSLGRVRDLDVFIEKARSYLVTLPEAERPGLEPLMSTWQHDRAVERDKLETYLDSEKYQQFKLGFNEFVSTPGAGSLVDLQQQPAPFQVRHHAPVLIYTRLAEVRANEAIVANAAIEQLHILRIAFKKLRYTLEFFQEVLGGQVKPVIQEIKTMQDHLGNLNDANVACTLLREFVETWEARQINLPLQERQNPQPVVTYLAAKHTELHRLIVTFPEAWSRFNRPDLIEKISQAVSVL